MERKKFKRVTRSSPLTSAAAKRDQDLRQKIMKEFPPLEPRTAESGGISDALRAAIQSSGKSIYQIGKDAGVSQIIVSRFLSGERDIRLATADRLARALGIMVAEKT
jgi:hypothetical protein